MKRVFVTASGTDVGKTFVMCRLIAEFRAEGRRVRALKPVATGFDPANPEVSDTGRLIQAQHLPLTAEVVDATTRWRFAAPLSPDAAARREHRGIPFEELVAFCAAPADADTTLIEGVGGVMVPIDAEHTVLDWIEALAAKVLLVAGSYLGTLSHTLTAIEALRSRGIAPAAVIVSESPQQPMPLVETVETMQRFVPRVPVVCLSRGVAEKATAARLMRLIE
jgi:dethiobiotin synthetase